MHSLVPDLACLFVMFQTVEAIDSVRDILQADLHSKAEMVPDLTCLFVMFQTLEAIDSERDILQADLDSKAEMVANLTEELELGHQQADDANRCSLLTCLGQWSRLAPRTKI